IPGLNGAFLTAVGKTKLLMYISLTNMLLNVILNIILIPTYGMIGAATATISARIFVNVTKTTSIYRSYGIHPFKRNYIVPTISAALILIAILIGPFELNSLSFAQGFAVAVAFGVLYLAIIFATRSIFTVELRIMDELFEKFGINIPLYNKLKRFSRDP
ncbi:MAG: polysaccharide biosynthesis C-terminal domain-containing protein, partial [Halobacteriaceae archaeon]